MKPRRSFIAPFTFTINSLLPPPLKRAASHQLHKQHSPASDLPSIAFQSSRGHPELWALPFPFLPAVQVSSHPARPPPPPSGPSHVPGTTTPLVAIALMEMAVSIVCENRDHHQGGGYPINTRQTLSPLPLSFSLVQFQVLLLPSPSCPEKPLLHPAHGRNSSSHIRELWKPQLGL